MTRDEIREVIKKAKELKIEELDLSNKDLDQIPKEIATLEHLKSLNLSYNNIKTLPKQLFELRNLNKLLLARNNLTDFPEEITKLYALEYLDISYNEITILPEQIGTLENLKVLDVSFCDIENLPLSLTDLINLQTLSLESNPLEYPPLKVAKRGLYAVMHYLMYEKRKNEAYKITLQVFNMPKVLQEAFKEYLGFFKEMVSNTNNKKVEIELNFSNHDFYQNLMIKEGIDDVLHQILLQLQEKFNLSSSTTEIHDEKLLKETLTRVKDELNKLNFVFRQEAAHLSQIESEIDKIRHKL